MEFLIPNLFLVLFNVTNSRIDAYKITKLHKTIRHGINLGAYLIFASILVFICKMELWWAVTFILSSFFNRQITFDIPLNIRRGLKWDYVSLDKPPKAFMDRIEVAIFGYNGRLPVLIYGSFWALSLIIQYFIHA